MEQLRAPEAETELATSTENANRLYKKTACKAAAFISLFVNVDGGRGELTLHTHTH